MKLRNKKTGEIIDLTDKRLNINSGYKNYGFNSLAELNDDWEDYDETETYFINAVGGVDINALADKKARENFYKQLKAIGNYFETKGEAMKAVEKLKAWKQLEDDGISFSLEEVKGKPYIEIHSKEENGPVQKVMRIIENLTILFGGEDDE